MNYCLRGRQLLLDLQRSEFLPPWDEEGVRTVANEINDMFLKISDNIDDDGNKINNAYYGLSLVRNRRYLSSYMINRIHKISSLKWQVGTVLPDVIRHEILSQRENDFYSTYCDILGEYQEEVGLDLSTDLEVCSIGIGQFTLQT